MNGTKAEQDKAIRYYDNISNFYDIISNWYYRKARKYAITKLKLENGQTVLNLPCGTGVNFEYFQSYLKNSGLIIGIDLSEGMLTQAKRKIEKNNWTNIELISENATKIDQKWLNEHSSSKEANKVDAVFCDLGLYGLHDWKNIIENVIGGLKPGGQIVILDWYLEKPRLLGKLIKWIVKGEVERPLWQYLESNIVNFDLKWFGIFDGVFVASGYKPYK